MPISECWPPCSGEPIIARRGRCAQWSALGAVLQPEGKRSSQVPHELLQADALLTEAEWIGRICGECDAQSEQTRCQNSIGGVVLQSSPLWGQWARPALESDCVHDAVAGLQHRLELGRVHAIALQTLGKSTVDVLPSPAGGLPLESDIVIQNPVVQV